jgi:acyl-CoA synthetase (AMP-forming)/AMP-acid ligase II
MQTHDSDVLNQPLQPDATRWSALVTEGEPTRPALIFDEGSVLTYGQLSDAAQACAARRVDGHRRLLALVAEPTPEALAVYVGALVAGDAVVLVPPGQPELLSRVVERFRPHDVAERAAGGWQYRRRHDFDLELDPTLALLLSTSGSTGEAKFVRLSYGNLIANAASIAQYLGIDASERGLMNLPPHYSYGASILHSHLVKGATVLVSARSVTDDALWRFFDAQRGTSVPGVPHSYALLEASGFFERPLPSLRSLTQAGGRLDPAMARRVADWSAGRGVRFFIMYGQTEASPRIAFVPPELVRDHVDAIGRVVPGGTLTLVDEQGQVIDAAGVEGELQYSGPNVMMGYATRAADLALPAGPSVLKTGDLAVRDPSGLFRITGRRSRFLKLMGLRVSTDEIERHLADEGLAVACAGSDEFLGVLVAGTEAQTSEAARKAAERSGLPLMAVVGLAVPSLPRLSNGKVDEQRVKTLLQTEHERRQSTAERSIASGERRAADRVRAAFESAFPGHRIDPDDSFTRLGGDSLRYVSVSVALERLIPDLPRQWNQLPLSELQRRAQEGERRAATLGLRASRWQPLDTSVGLRAIAILLVVINHSGLHMFAGGAALLLAAAGVNLLRFQSRNLALGEWQPVVRSFFVNLLLPYWLVAGGYGLLRGSWHWADMLLLGNFFVAHPRWGPNSGFETWFVAVLAQSLLIVMALSLIPAVRRVIAERLFEGTVVLLIIGVTVRLLEPIFFPELLRRSGGRELTWQFWQFALGMVVFAATTTSQRRLATVFVLVLPFMLYKLSDPSRVVILTTGLLLLLWVSHLRAPVVVVPVLRVLASASLFIYLLHSRARIDSFSSDWSVDVVRVVMGVVLGVAGWAVYDWLLRRALTALDSWRLARRDPMANGARPAGYRDTLY